MGAISNFVFVLKTKTRNNPEWRILGAGHYYQVLHEAQKMKLKDGEEIRITRIPLGSFSADTGRALIGDNSAEITVYVKNLADDWFVLEHFKLGYEPQIPEPLTAIEEDRKWLKGIGDRRS